LIRGFYGKEQEKDKFQKSKDKIDKNKVLSLA